MFEKEYFTYILASRKGGALYVGVTNNIEGRVLEHKEGSGSKHTAKYKINKLVYYDCFDNINDAIDWEKKLKRWKRSWKNELIAERNPEWLDLSEDFFDP